MAVVGYARVSSVGQSLDVQLEKLKGCDKVFREKRSGVDTGRPALKQCLEFLRDGDALLVTKIDRLARSTSDLYRIVSELGDKGVSFKVLDDPSIDTKSRTGKLVMGILALIAEFENDIRRERQMDGIAKAKDRGVKLGGSCSSCLKEWSKYKISGLEVLRCRTSFSGPASARRASIEPWGAESLSWAWRTNHAEES
jgi:DNA invertase Pin-like site-specific DNA recombinase